MNEIRQCWAFHSDGTRCELPAAHPGDHAVERTWTDAQCATPGQLTVKSEPAASNYIDLAKGELVEKQIKCVACGHSHRNGACKCGCHEFIG